jgi:hypothetical protein
MCRQANSRKMKQIPEGAYVCKTRNRALEKPLAQTRVALVVLPAPPNISPIVIRNLGSTFSEIGSGKLTDEALHKRRKRWHFLVERGPVLRRQIPMTPHPKTSSQLRSPRSSFFLLLNSFGNLFVLMDNFLPS